MLLELDWPPTVNTYYRTVMIGNTCRVLLSAKARAYRESVKARAYREAAASPVFRTERLRVTLMLHAPTRHKYDIDNRAKAVLDSLEHAGVYANDEQIDRLDIQRGEVRPRDGAVFVLIKVIEAGE